MYAQQSVVGDQKEQVMSVRTMVRDEKSGYYSAKKKVVNMRAKTAIGTREAKSKLPPTSRINSSRRENQTRYVGGGFAVTNATLENPTTKPRAFPASEAPLSALYTSPRKTRDVHTAIAKLPSGWNPKRQPVSPYLPVLSDSK